MESKFKIFDLSHYQITPDYEKSDSPHVITDPQILKHVEKIYQAISDNRSNSLYLTEKFHKKFPELPLSKNLLCKGYIVKGQKEKAKKINDQLLEAHPDYIFAITNAAMFQYYEEKPENMLLYLGENLDLNKILPERKVFYESEILSYLEACGFYFIGTKQLNETRKLLRIIKKIDPENEMVSNINDLMFPEYPSIEDDNELFGVNEMPEQKTSAPELHHPELQVLYERGLSIDSSTLQNLLSLPRESLIDDLKAILLDSIYRYDYFYNIDFEENIHTFPVHAFFMLGELKANEALDTILYFLSMPKKVLDYWFGDILLEKSWLVVYLTGNDQLNKLEAFVLDQKNNYLMASGVSNAVEQIVYHQPGRRNEIIKWFKNNLEVFLARHQQGEFINSELVSFLVWDVMNIKAKELADLMEKLYDENLISEEMIGDLDNIITSLSEHKDHNHKRSLTNIFETYKDIQKWFNEDDEDDEDDYDFDIGDDDGFEDEYGSFEDYEDELEESINNPFLRITNPTGPIKAEKKIGRNDLCPCGSGKKYKKCCMDK